MWKHLLRRLLLIPPTVLCVVTIVFFLIHMGVGNPAQAILGTYASAQSLEAFRAELGLDKPLIVQYGEYLSHLAHGDLGRSLITSHPVAEQLRSALPYSLELTIAGILLGLVLGIPLGILMSVRQNTWIDSVGRIMSLVGISMPAFFLGVVLLIIFAVKLDWFPVGGVASSESIVDRIHHLVLPAVTLGLVMTSYIARTTRSAVLNVLGEDYLRTARAKGQIERRVLLHHALHNALIPVITVTGMYATILLAVSPLVEIVFGRPGLGRLILGSIKQSDYIVLQSVMLVYAAMVIVVNLLVDLSYSLIDPRIRFQ